MASLDPVVIDGSFGEGGGQIIRTSVSLAALTGRSVEIQNVRGKRAKPGLQPQHLMAVRAAAQICGARLTGDAVGSVYLKFEPTTEVRGGDYFFDIGTAGSTNLVAQTLLVPLAHGKEPSTVRIKGGTYNPMAPAADYVERVYMEALRRAGFEGSFRSPIAGFYPIGGGEVHLSIVPSSLTGIELLGGAPADVSAHVVTSSLPEHVGERGAAKARAMLGSEAQVEHVAKPSPGTGAAVVVVASGPTRLGGFTGLGERGKPMERVVEEPCKEYLAWLDTEAGVDEHLADQLVLPMALAHGASRWSTNQVTEHLRTVVWLLQHFMEVTAEIQEHPDGSGEVMLVGGGVKS